MALVGSNTYGKPVGQIALDRSQCDDRLRVVAFRTENASRQGDYYTGLASTVPATLPGVRRPQPAAGRPCRGLGQGRARLPCRARVHANRARPRRRRSARVGASCCKARSGRRRSAKCPGSISLERGDQAALTVLSSLKSPGQRPFCRVARGGSWIDGDADGAKEPIALSHGKWAVGQRKRLAAGGLEQAHPAHALALAARGEDQMVDDGRGRSLRRRGRGCGWRGSRRRSGSGRRSGWLCASRMPALPSRAASAMIWRTGRSTAPSCPSP